MNGDGHGIDPRFFLWSGILVFVGFDAWHGYLIHDPVRIAIFAWVIFLMVGTILHELGHAVAAKALGSEVFRIKLGLKQNPTGPHFGFRFLGFPWEIYSFPLTGTVWAFTTSPQRYRRRCVAITAAGPATSLFLAGVGGLALFWPLSFVVHGLLWGWVAANTFLFLATAIPIKITYGGKPQVNDGINICRHLALKDEEIFNRCRTAAFGKSVFLASRETKGFSVGQLISLHEAQPDNVGFLAQLLLKITGDDHPDEARYVLEFARRSDVPTKNMETLLDGWLTSGLLKARVAPPEIYDEVSAVLVRVSGDSITAQGTRGSVLVEIGRVDEGASLLEKVLEKSSAGVDQAYAHVFLALAEKRRHNLEKAHFHAETARRLFPDCPALARVGEL